MATVKISKQRKVINYLVNGNTLTAAQARNWYGVKNLRATMSDIRPIVQEYGNWKVIMKNGRYSMIDTHPGKRVFRFTKSGRRTRIN